MKKNQNRMLSVILAGSLLLGEAAAAMSAAPVYAAGVKKNAEKSKYISDVFISYGKTEEEAVKWLTDNGWEPLTGNRDINAGKNSSDGKPVAAVMGIRRTDNAKEAITDMAVMNMTGGYSFPEYEKLVDDKRDEIDAFICSFLPTIEEFRANYNGEGSESGQDRAELAYALLNHYYDGGPEERYAVNDTGLPLGDLFLSPLMQEGGGDGSGDLEQIILEGAGPSVSAVENLLALAADAGEDTWLDRLRFLTMDELLDNVGSYVPEAEYQDVAPSAVMNYYMEEYGDAADTLAEQWDDVHEMMQWYEEFTESHDLGTYDTENEEECEACYADAVEELQADETENPQEELAEMERYTKCSILYEGLYGIAYPGDWGDTLGDFFNPDKDSSYSGDTESYLPLAVALSEGQRKALSFLSMETLLMMGLLSGEEIRDLFDDVDELTSEDATISVYSGMNRGIFRDGIALTSQTLMEMQKGNDVPEFVETEGISKSLFVGMLVTGCVLAAAGIGVLGFGIYRGIKSNYFIQCAKIRSLNKEYAALDFLAQRRIDLNGQIRQAKDTRNYTDSLYHVKSTMAVGIILTSIGAGLMIYALVSKISETHQTYEAYHNKEFTKIPAMIVDEKDIVTYVEEDGEKKACIEFDQYAYYEAVKCNRQSVGELSKWQKGVSDYEAQGCGDVADLNADHGLEWLALYMARAYEKGEHPILADSLNLSYGEKSKPGLDTPTLHYFCNFGRADLADRAYCYSNDKGKMYFSWNVEKAA